MPLKGGYRSISIAEDKLEDGLSFALSRNYSVGATAAQNTLIQIERPTVLESVAIQTITSDCEIGLYENPDSFTVDQELDIKNNNRNFDMREEIKAYSLSGVTLGGAELLYPGRVEVEAGSNNKTIIGGFFGRVKPIKLNPQYDYLLQVTNLSDTDPTEIYSNLEFFF